MFFQNCGRYSYSHKQQVNSETLSVLADENLPCGIEIMKQGVTAVSCDNDDIVFSLYDSDGIAAENNETAQNEIALSNPIHQSVCSVFEVQQGFLIACDEGFVRLIKTERNLNNHSNDSLIFPLEQALASSPQEEAADLCDKKQTAIGTDFSTCTDQDIGNDLVAYSVAERIDPCGNESTNDEVLLRFTNGEIIAHQSDEGRRHFSLIKPGRYKTEDGTRCVFDVLGDGSVTW